MTHQPREHSPTSADSRPNLGLPPPSRSSSLLSLLTSVSLSPLCLPVWHSDGLALLALNPPTLFHSLRLDSYILAQGLFLSALLVTKLFGTAPGPPPVIHSARQTCKYSLSRRNLHPLPTSGLWEPCPGCRLPDPWSLEHLWNPAGPAPAPAVSPPSDAHCERKCKSESEKCQRTTAIREHTGRVHRLLGTEHVHRGTVTNSSSRGPQQNCPPFHERPCQAPGFPATSGALYDPSCCLLPSLHMPRKAKKEMHSAPSGVRVLLPVRATFI